MMKVRTNCLYLILENLDMNGDCIREKSILDVLIVEYWSKEIEITLRDIVNNVQLRIGKNIKK